MMEAGGSRYIAVAASVLLHAGALLLVWQLPPSVQTQQQAHATSMQVVLLTPAAAHQVMPAAAASSGPLTLPSPPQPGRGHSLPTPTSAPEGIAPQDVASAPVSPAGDVSIGEIAMGRKNRHDVAPDAASTISAETEPGAVAGGTADRPSAMAATTARYTSEEVMASLEEAFAVHFYYPMLARRKGWEGEVMVGLRIETDGRLTGIHVVGSSGYLVLDNAAIDSLSRARAVSLPGGALGNSLDMELPVQYRLLDIRV